MAKCLRSDGVHKQRVAVSFFSLQLKKKRIFLFSSRLYDTGYDILVRNFRCMKFLTRDVFVARRFCVFSFKIFKLKKILCRFQYIM